MHCLKLSLEPDITEFMVFGSNQEQNKLKSDFLITIVGTLLFHVSSVRNLGLELGYG